eukprot:TRINITY_DN14324_c0_g5_i1.p1 TRINITY_DN14324_c0_g5~~TRINITY_DN14324_c0_g5_i1.p1  ORF type:complete len:737 (+),score=90.83 TRINITY_DN14324_c0_g5_i1:82-2292(+)
MAACVVGQHFFVPALRRTATAPAPASTCAVAAGPPVRTISVGPSQGAATTSAAADRRQTIACLPTILKAHGLEQQIAAIEKWCSSMGAAWMDEIFENATDIAQTLQMSDNDRARFMAVTQPESLTMMLDRRAQVAPFAAPTPIMPADVVENARLRCPSCLSSAQMLRCVTIAAQHEGWGRKWNDCAYACLLCQRQIRREGVVNVCTACKQFWHENCNKAAEEDALAEQRASEAAAWAAKHAPRRPAAQPATRIHRYTKKTKVQNVVQVEKQLLQKNTKNPKPSAPLSAPCTADMPKTLLLQRARTYMVTTPWQGAQSVDANPASSTNLLLNRTKSTPATEQELIAAAHRASTAYVPLQAWNFKKTLATQQRARNAYRSNTEVPLSTHECVIETTEPLPNQMDRRVRLERRHLLRLCGTREAHVDSELLRRPIPSDAELQNPFLSELEHEKAVSAEMGTERVSFDQMRNNFMRLHGSEIRSNLQSVFDGPVKIEPAPVAPAIKKQFMESSQNGGNTIVPTYHGSNSANYPSIFERGLLIPGRRNELKIVHGAAHGRGIYTAQVNAPDLSRGFCTEPKMLVCGVADDAQALLSTAACGSQRISAQSNAIRHVGDAVVVFDEKRVVPLYQASGDAFKSSRYSSQRQRPTATITLNSWLGVMAPGTGLPNPNWPQVSNKTFVDAGKGKVFHTQSRQLAFRPPQPLDASNHEINQKRIYERKIRQQGRVWLRAEKAAAHNE